MALSGLSSPFRRSTAGPRADREALRAHAWSKDAAWPPGLELEWLGTAGFRLSCEGTHLLIDPYVSRLSLGDFLTRRRARADDVLVRRHVPRASAVLVGHTHFDHAIDVPKISEIHGCPVYGSSSLLRLMSLYGLGDRATEVVPYRVHGIGPFEVTFVPTVHSKLFLGLKVPFDGELTCEHASDLTAGAYRCGQVWGIHIAVRGVTFYHQGSADVLEDAVRHRGVDYFLAGISGRSVSPRYVERVLRALGPRVIVPMHYDDFFRPVDAPMGLLRNVNVTGFVDEVRAASREPVIMTVEPFATIG